MENNQLADKVDLSIIRYANVWEDASLLLKTFQPLANGRFLSICSGLDNSLALLLLNPEYVIAVDINKTQLWLAELKIAAIQSLNLEEYKSFIGINENKNRLAAYNHIKSLLSPEAQKYWNQNISMIEAGITTSGKFENYFSIFRKYVLPFIHSQKQIRELLRKKTAKEQVDYYHNTWNNRRWQFLFKIFFSKKVMGNLGRDPEFLKQVNLKVSDYIFGKAEEHLTSIACQQNYILEHIMTGNYQNNVPPYLLPENYPKIKSRLHKIKLFEGYAQNAIKEYGPFDGMNLSNIFEYLDHDLFTRTSEALVNGLNNHGRIAYWNLMVNRRISKTNKNVEFLEVLSEELTQQDKGFFYNCFIAEEKKKK